MPNTLRFPYTITNPALGESSSLPYLPLTRLNQQHAPQSVIEIRPKS